MSAYLYILYSEKTDRYYVGSADDVEARLKHHNAGSTPSTKAGAPLWELKYTEEYPTRSDARKREYAIKRKKSRKYIEWLIGQLE
jgi:putative endonuclease